MPEKMSVHDYVHCSALIRYEVQKSLDPVITRSTQLWFCKLLFSANVLQMFRDYLYVEHG
jgi:hypothetical protein